MLFCFHVEITLKPKEKKFHGETHPNPGSDVIWLSLILVLAVEGFLWVLLSVFPSPKKQAFASSSKDIV